jgi:L-ribulose-5-phosphate 3-epimerase
MHNLKPLEIGVMFWAGTDPAATLGEVKAFGVRCGQVGIPGSLPLDASAAAAWREALANADFTLVTAFAAYTGESYADVPTVQRTVGFIPRATRAERERRTLDLSDFAAAAGIPGIACHIGFVPEDPGDPDYIDVRGVVRRIADRAAKHGQTFALETGQEPAAVLERFLADVDRENVRINFDPANMILYGTGDPMEALAALAPRVISVHAKDGDWPPRDRPEALGTETPLGQGAVNIPKFVSKLKEVGYTGTLNIEREVDDPERRRADIQAAVALLKGLLRD